MMPDPAKGFTLVSNLYFLYIEEVSPPGLAWGSPPESGVMGSCN